MSVEKVTKNFLKHATGLSFTTILNETLLSIRDAGALGIYVYLASKPADWQICQKNLMNHFGVGKKYMIARFKYLKEIGLIEKQTVRNDKGHILHWETILHRQIPENPYCGDIQNTPKGVSSEIDNETILDNDSIQIPPNQQCGKSAPTNKRGLQKKETNKQSKDANALIISEPEVIEPSKQLAPTKQQLTPQTMLIENPHNIPEQLLMEWQTVRRAKRSPITPTAWRNINRELGKCKCTPIEAFEEMLARGWLTVKADWINKGGNKHETHFDHTDTSWGKDLYNEFGF